GAVVVLDAGHHRVRAAGLVLGAAIVALGSGLGMAMARHLAHRPIFVRRKRGGSRGCFGFLAQALGFLFFLALALGGFLGAALVLFSQALLLAEVALARLLELAQDLGALVVAGCGGLLGRGGCIVAGTRLDQGDLLADDDVHRRSVLAAADGELLLAAAAERDLLRCDRVLGGLAGLAVGAAQEAQQLDLLGAGHDLVGIAELHAGLGQLFQQFLDRRVHQCGKLADGGLLRHSVSMSFGVGLG